MAAAMMQPGQVFIAISHSGSTLDVIEAVQAANKAGATGPSVFVTPPPLSF